MSLLFRAVPLRFNFFSFCIALGVACVCFSELVTAQESPENTSSKAGSLEPNQYVEVKEAIAAFKQGNFPQSLELLKLASKNHSELAPAHVIQAKLYFAAGRQAEGMDALELAVAADRDDPEAFLMMGDLALRNRQVTLAELAIKQAVELTEKFTKNKKRLAYFKVRTLAGQSLISQIRGLPDKTIEYASAWSEMDDKNSKPHELLAQAYFEQKKYLETYAELKKVAELNPKSQRAEIMLAYMYENAGLHKTAKESMELAIKLGGDELRTRLTVAEWALSSGLLEMAEANVKAARKLDKDSLEALILAGRLARFHADRETALKLLQEAVLRSPSHFGATNQLALALSGSTDEKDLQRGIQYAAVNLRTHADSNTAISREAAVTYAWLAFKMGKSSEAEKAIQSAIRGGSISSESAYYVAKMIASGNNKPLAMKILKPVLAMNRAFPYREAAQELLTELEANSSDDIKE